MDKDHLMIKYMKQEYKISQSIYDICNCFTLILCYKRNQLENI